MNEALNKIKIEYNNLEKLFYDSFMKYPRKYLFEMKNNLLHQLHYYLGCKKSLMLMLLISDSI